jgi:ribosomal protein S18 acetylase RimI-like enzyme
MLEDAQGIAGLLNACAVERTGKPSTSVQAVRSIMQMPSVDLETDTLLALGSEGQLVGFALVLIHPPSPLIRALTELHPQHWDKGIGTTLCGWIEERARRSIPELEAGARIALLQNRLSTDVSGRDLLLGEGYRVVRYNFRMAIELDAPLSQEPVPEGITIRPFVREAEGHALVRALRETFCDNWGYVDRGFEGEYKHWMHLLDRDPDCDPAPFWFVALEGVEIVGLALCNSNMSEDPEMAWIWVVGVRPAWRRRGIALTLLQHSFGALRRAGKRAVSLEVDSENPTGARRLYEKAGMHVERQIEIFEKELRPDE